MDEQISCRVAHLGDLRPGTLTRVVGHGVEICLARRDDGEVFAVADSCTHEVFPLSDGDLEDSEVICPLHGSRFDIETGEVFCPPALDPVRTFPVTIVGDEVFVNVGASALASSARDEGQASIQERK